MTLDQMIADAAPTKAKTAARYDGQRITVETLRGPKECTLFYVKETGRFRAMKGGAPVAFFSWQTIAAKFPSGTLYAC